MTTKRKRSCRLKRRRASQHPHLPLQSPSLFHRRQQGRELLLSSHRHPRPVQRPLLLSPRPSLPLLQQQQLLHPHRPSLLLLLNHPLLQRHLPPLLPLHPNLLLKLRLLQCLLQLLPPRPPSVLLLQKRQLPQLLLLLQQTNLRPRLLRPRSVPPRHPSVEVLRKRLLLLHQPSLRRISPKTRRKPKRPKEKTWRWVRRLRRLEGGTWK
mmetsp:Transcript_48310/g.95359  ORF Transcript_48310/g.95359 Transcript_48310/m.95359 type:complete len:209 (+) Transcript_48310:1512-2138(+)